MPVRKTKKKAEVEDDEDEDEDGDAPVKKVKAKRLANVVEEDEDDEDADTDDDDDAETEEEDDEEESDEDDDDAEDADSDDDDEEEAESTSGGGSFSWDPDDAEAGGLPEGRVVLLNPKTRYASTANYEEDDDSDGVPVLSVTCVPITKKGAVESDPFRIHLSAGKRARIAPTSDGTDFEPADGSSARGLSKSSNAYFFIKSLTDAGFPKPRFAKKKIAAIHGLVGELTRVPQPERKGLGARDEEDDRGPRTMPTVSEIFYLPGSEKGAKSVEAAVAALKKTKKGAQGKKKGATSLKGGKKSPKAAGEATEPRTSDKSKGVVLTGNGLRRAAERALVAALQSSKYKDRGIDLDDSYNAAFQQVKTHPQRGAILSYFDRTAWVTEATRPWSYDPKAKRITATTAS